MIGLLPELSTSDYESMLGALLPRGPYWDRSALLSESDDWIIVVGDGLTDGRQALRIVDSDIARPNVRDLVAASLFTWRRALDDDPIADGESRQGWWADPTFGSRLYLLLERELTPEVLTTARRYAAEALEWLVGAGIVSTITVEVMQAGKHDLAFNIAFARPRDPRALERYGLLWRS